MSEEQLDPKEQQTKYLEEMEWPPIVNLGDEHNTTIKLDELDVNWTFCNVLGMRWADAKGITDVGERKFLWAKAQLISASMEQQNEEVQAKKQQLEASIDRKIQQMNDESLEQGINKAVNL